MSTIEFVPKNKFFRLPKFNFWHGVFLTIILFLLLKDEVIPSSENHQTVPVQIQEETVRQSKTVQAALVAPKPKPVPKPITVFGQPLKVAEKYVDRFSSVAVVEMKKYGIPASITLAQGLLESACGTSSLSRKHNNHFGMKCHSRKCSKGHCVNRSDDSHKDFFRKYDKAWTSYRAHSDLLSNNERYAFLFELERTDYEGWSHGLKKAGYATDPKYAFKLIGVIEAMQLHQFDE